MNSRLVGRFSRNLGAQNWLVLAGFLALALLLRLGAFPRSVIDFDESFFLLMGRSLLRGEIPYTVITSHDPIGTAVLFALAQAVFGQSVIAIRLLTWLAAGLESFLLYRLAITLLGRRGVAIGLIAGALYAFFTLQNLGLAAHREMFLAPCMTFAVIMVVSGVPGLSAATRSLSQSKRGTYAVRQAEGDALQQAEGPVQDAGTRSLSQSKRGTYAVRQAQGPVQDAGDGVRSGRLLLAGLAMGLALHLKYMYVFELVALYLIATGAVVLTRRGRPRDLIRDLLTSYVLLAVGPLLVTGLVALYFVLAGHWNDFFGATVLSAVTYAGVEPFAWAELARRVLQQIQSNTLLWLGVALAPVYLIGVKDRDREFRWALLCWLIWFALAFVGTSSTRKFFEHYYLQLVPAASLITAAVAVAVLRSLTGHGRLTYGLALVLVFAGPLFSMGYWPLFDSAAVIYRHYLRGQPLPADGPRVVSDYLQTRVTPEDYVYVADYEPIVNYMVDARIPTRYAFSIYLTDQIFARERIDQVGELRQIFAKRPLYVIKQSPPSADFVNPPFAAELERHLAQDYTLEKTFPAIATFTAQPMTVEVYRLRSSR